MRSRDVTSHSQACRQRSPNVRDGSLNTFKTYNINISLQHTITTPSFLSPLQLEFLRFLPSPHPLETFFTPNISSRRSNVKSDVFPFDNTYNSETFRPPKHKDEIASFKIADIILRLRREYLLRYKILIVLVTFLLPNNIVKNYYTLRVMLINTHEFTFCDCTIFENGMVSLNLNIYWRNCVKRSFRGIIWTDQ